MLKIILYSALLLTFFSCTKVVDVTLRDAPPKLVIQGNITNEPGPYTVALSQSVAYAESNNFPAVSGAQVSIKEINTGITDVLTEAAPGIYQTHPLLGTGTLGHTYQLNVVVDGNTYTSSGTMPDRVNLDSITFQTVAAFGFSITNPLPNFQDPANVPNYYQFKQSINKKISNSIFVFDDRLSDGKYISRQLFNDSAYIQKGDTVQLEMLCIDKNIYNFYKELSGIDPYNGQPTSPANPTTNITGGALGYFSVHTTQKKSAVAR